MTGPVAVVTGGGSGIGRATAHALARDGYHVVVADRDGDGAKRTAEAVGGEAAVLDVTDVDAVRALAAALGPVGALVNSAGVWTYAPLESMPVADARRVLEVNVLGPWLLAQAVAEHMPAGGAIVNLSSTSFTIVPAEV
ncbi:MAG TPA: SDR family oxidoreductase, partial [Amycolatopsis sp.]|nr:SDR family oxidoreductase [Amycolatopsis sp.]